MRAKVAAVVGGLIIAAVGFGVGLPMANANPSGGGQCNNYGNGNVIVAPFCGAQGIVPTTAPAQPTTTTTTTSAHVEICPPYCGAGGPIDRGPFQ